MFAIKIRDDTKVTTIWRTLVLGDKFSIGLEFNHPGLVEDIDLGDFSFPISVPDDDQGVNRQIFGFANRIQVGSVTRKYDAVLEINTNYYRKATVILDRISDKTFNGYVKLGIYQLPTLDKKLKDINYEGDIYMGADNDAVVAFANATNTDIFPNKKFCFPCIHNPDFYEDKNPDFAGIINRYDITNSTFLKNTSANTDCLVPMPYIKYILQRIAADAGYTMAGAFWTDTKQDRAYIFNNFALDGGSPDSYVRAGFESDHTMPETGEAYFICPDDSTPPNSDVNSLYDTSLGEYSIPITGPYRIQLHLNITGRSSTAPNLAFQGNTAYYVIVYIRRFSGATLLGQWTQTLGPVASTNTVANLDLTPFILTGNAGDTIKIRMDASGTPNAYLIVLTYHKGTSLVIQDADFLISDYQRSMNIHNHVPDWTVRDFLRELKRLFLLTFYVDDVAKKIYADYSKNYLVAAPKDFTPEEIPGHEMQFNTQIIKTYGYEFSTDDAWNNDNVNLPQPLNFEGQVDDFDSLPAPTTPGRTALVENENRYYITVQNDSGLEWQHYSDNYPHINISNEGTLNLRTKLTPLFMTHFDSTMTGNVRMPTIKQPGSSALFGLGLNPSEPRVAYFKTITVSPSTTYPFSTPLNLDPGLATIGVYNMMVDAEQKLANQGMYVTFWRDWLALINQPFIYNKYLDLDVRQLFQFITTDLIYLSRLVWLIRKANITMKGNKIDPVRLELMRTK